MRTWLAFHRRDTRERRSRLLAGLAEGSGILLTVVTFYFLGELVDRGTSGEVARLNGSYFAFAVNGIAMAGFLAQTVRGHSRALRTAQLEGTLEPMLMTPVPPWRIAVGGALHEMTRGLLRLFVYLGFATALGAVALDGQLAWLPVVLAVAALSFLPFGLLAASYTLLLARGEPVTYLTNAGTLLLAGVYFPSSVLPAWLQPVSLLYPVTHAVQALRSVTSGTESPLASLLWLLGFTAVALPLTAWAFQRCVLVARRRGTLGMT